MALIAILARQIGREGSALRALFLAGFIMLLYNPLSLLNDPSFQLSFMATLGLILFSPFVFSKLSFISEKLGLREIASATIAVQLFILPLIINISGFISLVSFAANLLVLPLVPLAMLLGFLTGLTGFISQIISWPFGVLSYLVSEVIIVIANFAGSLKYGQIHTGILPLWMVLIFYIGSVFFYLKIKKQKEN